MTGADDKTIQYSEGEMPPAPLPRRDPLIGVELGECRLEKVLGKGGMATVYLARQAGLDREVAVKVLSPRLSRDLEQASQFAREAKLLARLEHPNIVTVFQVGQTDTQQFLVLQLVRGGSLGDLLKERGAFPADEVREIGLQIAKGLREAHQSGMIHRDIKPDNVLVGKGPTYKITDFGLAMMDNQATAALGRVVGTPHYISPEQVDAREVDARTDIYSLGATLYHMLTGTPPFKAPSTLELLMKHVNQPLVPPHEREPSVPTGISKVVCRMMAKQPGQRQASMDEVLADLAAPERAKAVEPEPAAEEEVRTPTLLLSEQPLPLLRPSPATRPRAPKAVSLGGIAVLVGGALLIGLGLGPIREVLADVQGPAPRALALEDELTLQQLDLEAKAMKADAALARYRALAKERAGTPLAAEAERRCKVLEDAIRNAQIAKLDGIIAKAGKHREQVELGPALDLLRGMPEELAGLPRAAEVESLIEDLEKELASLGMAWVPPAAEVTLGEGEAARTVKDAPGFYMQLQEVTAGSFAEMADAPGVGKALPSKSPDHPVVGVSLAQAEAYAKARGLRIPTADEWERAARGPEGRRWPWGDEVLVGAANAGPDAKRAQPPGGSKLDVSPVGCLDMAGNVAELTVGPDGQPWLRGGSYETRTLENARGAFYLPIPPKTRHAAIGFRCATDTLPKREGS